MLTSDENVIWEVSYIVGDKVVSEVKNLRVPKGRIGGKNLAKNFHITRFTYFFKFVLIKKCFFAKLQIKNSKAFEFFESQI